MESGRVTAQRGPCPLAEGAPVLHALHELAHDVLRVSRAAAVAPT